MIRSLLILLTVAAMAMAAIGSTGANFSSTNQSSGNSYTAAADWVAPSVSVNDPGANIRATVSIGATATDSASGVQSVTIQRSPAGAGTWTTICTSTTFPYSCSFDTTTGATPDGLYDLRATAIDNVGNSATSSTLANRRIDNTVPTGVTVTDPGTNLAGTLTLSGAASDSGSGIASVAVQYKPSAGSTWTTACSDTTAPYSCTYDSTSGGTPDGLYDFRSLATDNAGNTATSSAVTSKRVDNTGPTGVTMTDPGTPISGTKSFSGTATDAGSGVASVRFQYRPSSGGVWLDACTDPSSPYSCSTDTTLITDGLYDFQALATDNAGNTTVSSTWTSRRIDNVAPTSTMNDPGQYLRGTISLTASASDGGGIANVVIQRRPNGGATWTTVCTATTSPYSCSLNTTILTDGLYDFQAIATDNASRSTTSTVVLARRVDNTAPASVTVTNPGTPISGNKTLTGSGTDGGSGIATIALQYSPTGANTWTTACSGTTSPTNCVWDSTTATDGLYDFRTQATDRAGNVTNSTTASPNSRVDNYFPTVTMNDPGAVLSGTVTFSATAADGGGIASVAIQYKPSASSTWSTLCTPTVAPYQCSISTIGGADGLYDFRAIATDNASKQTTSTVVANRRVDNTVPSSATMTDPGTPLSGTVTFSGTASDAGSGVDTVAFQYLNGATWTTLCSDSSAPYSCSGDTTAIADGSYSFRSLATDFGGNQTASATIASRVVDNNGPSVSVNDPGALAANETVTVTASDAGTGVSSVTMQYKPTAGSTWTNICVDNVAPYSCAFDTTGLVDGGQYDLRAIAVDGLSHSTTSAVVGPRVVDRSAPSVTLTDPGALRGTETLASTVSDSGSGVASVVYEYKTSAGSTWLSACTASSSPWSCSWSAAGLTEGTSYDVRATATDAAGNSATSTVTGRVADNDQTPSATAISAANGGATVGKMESGDSVTFTFSEPVAPGSILTGWDGTSTAVQVRVDDFTSGNLDRLSVWNSANTTRTNLTSDPASGGLQLAGNYVPSGGARFNATMVMSGSSVTVTFGSLAAGGVNSGGVGRVEMTWFPSTAATDLAGNAISSASVLEPGNDNDF